MIVVLRARDGFTFKDPRGFNVGGGAVATGLGFPLPATTVGAARTAVGRALGFSTAHSRGQASPWLALRDLPAGHGGVEVRGPIAVRRILPSTGEPGPWQPLWPAPRDAFLTAGDNEHQPRVAQLLPRPPGASEARCLGTFRAGLEAEATEHLWRSRAPEREKPLELEPLWSDGLFDRWLSAPTDVEGFDRRSDTVDLESRFDFHVAIDPGTQSATDGNLFGHDTVEMLGRPRRGGPTWESGIALEVTGGAPVQTPWRLGGEGRVADVENAPVSLFEPPRWLGHWPPARRLRLVLVTPGLFATGGWVPDWLTATATPHDLAQPVRFEGVLPGTNIAMVLRGALIGRPTIASGWDFHNDCPKPSQRLVPTGSVYFLETRDADREISAEVARSLWLQTLQGSGSQAARDGYGLAVPGLW